MWRADKHASSGRVGRHSSWAWWHDWWNAADRNARVRVEVTPGERLGHLLETFFGLARLGHTDSKGMPHVLQLALTGREFSDVIVFRSPPPAVQRLIFGALAPIARLARAIVRRTRSSPAPCSRLAPSTGGFDRAPGKNLR